MTTHASLLLAVYMIALLGLAWPLGSFMAVVLEGRRTWLSAALGPLERLAYRCAGVSPEAEMTWRGYAFAAVAFNGVGLIAVYLLHRTQQWLPRNPQHHGPVNAHSAYNTTVSFATE